ncbi:MAG: hypothetical protein PT120_01625 [Aphanizomenon gracile PMC649.10]|nr:hypothetical protein [Aphanizomenon gracile PMC649.10]
MQQRFAIALHIPNSDRSHHIPKKRTACSSASLSPPTSPTAIALTTSPKRDRTPTSQKVIALPTSPKAILSKNQPAKDFLNV